jgi:hypothetical protein
MTNRPVPPNGFIEVFEPCPECGWKGFATKVGTQKRCGGCGHQWPAVHVEQLGPTRADVLNGTARHLPTRIIRWRF